MAQALPFIGLGPAGWALGGIITIGAIVLAKNNKKKNEDRNIPHLPDNHNGGNPNNRGPNGDPEHPFFYHGIRCKSRKEAYERALKDGFGTRPVFHKGHFHPAKFRGGQRFKFGNAHYFW